MAQPIIKIKVCNLVIIFTVKLISESFLGLKNYHLYISLLQKKHIKLQKIKKNKQNKKKSEE